MGATKYKTEEVEISYDLSDFDNEEILYEAISRITRDVYSHSKKQGIRTACLDALASINHPIEEIIEVESVQDQIKYAHIAKVFDKYSIEDIERLLPE